MLDKCLKSSNLEEEERISSVRWCFYFIPIGTQWYRQNISCPGIECGRVQWLFKSVDIPESCCENKLSGRGFGLVWMLYQNV